MKIKLLKKIKSIKNLALGFSGGADSTALAAVLIEHGIAFSAVHFHHHLRSQSADQDAEFCKNFCDKNNIPFKQVDIPVNKLKESGESIESAARRMRMEYWEKHFSGIDSAVLLAHHKDDVLENFFIRSLRGSSSSGLSGLKEIKTINKVTYLRPLLDITKSEICEFLLQRKMDWCEDETNVEDIYTRNIIRNNVIPCLSNISPIEGLYRTVENVSLDADYIESQAIDWLIRNELNRRNFLSLHPALQPRVLRNFILKSTGKEFIPGHDAIERLNMELQREHRDNSTIPLGQGIELTLSTAGEIFVEPEPYEVNWNWKEKPEVELQGGIRLFVTEETTSCCESFDVNSLNDILKVRSWQPGDRMVPFSHNSQVKVKDLFADRKISHQLRHSLPLIFSEDNLIWIPTVRRAEFGLLKENSKSITLAYEKL